MDCILAYKGSRGLQKGGDEKFSKDAKFDTVCTTSSENIVDDDQSQRRIQHANLAGLQHILMLKDYVAE